ncbi:MAG TPA: hypothetical protein VFG62_07390, partial [Rhodopila sp.]|nr:hypothetical protein [Rhodopila sp.]
MFRRLGIFGPACWLRNPIDEKGPAMKNFLFVHLPAADGSAGHLLGALQGEPGISFTPAGKPHTKRLATWRLTDDGALELGQRRGTILGVAPDGTLRFHHLPAGQAVASADRWAIGSKNRLMHKASGRTIKVGRTNGAPTSLVLRDESEDDDQDPTIQEWGQAIQHYLTPPLPNPAFAPFGDGSAGYTAAYQYIEQLLLGNTTTDLRTYYQQAGNLIIGMRQNLESYACPSDPVGFDSDQFETVKATLLSEMGCVMNVNSLYSISQGFYNAVISNDNNEISILGTALTNAGSQAPSNPTLTAATFFEGILYTVFSVFGPEGGFIANVMAAAFNTAVASGALSTQAQTLDFTELQQQLQIQLQSIQSTLAQQQDTILSYGTIMQEVSNIYTSSPYTNEDVVNAQQAGIFAYVQQILQQVLPPLCQIGVIYFSSGTSTSPAPDYATYQYNNLSANFIYYIQMRNGANFPDTVTTELFNDPPAASNPNGLTLTQDPKEFYFGLNGWQWTNIQSPSPNFDSGNDMVISVYNATGDDMTMAVTMKAGYMLAPGTAPSCQIIVQPGALGVTISQYNANAIEGPLGLQTKIELTDDTDTTIARIEAHQNLLANPNAKCWT